VRIRGLTLKTAAGETVQARPAAAC
jgi:hypothetical protein